MNTNDVLAVAVNPTSIFDKLNYTYTINDFGPLEVHLGCEYAQVEKGVTNWWVMGSSTYITEFVRKVYTILNVTTLRKDKLTCSPGDHTELDLSPLLCEAQHRLYRQLFGMEKWAVQIGRFDIHYALTSINRFSASPR